jgi:hypothetical protein
MYVGGIAKWGTNYVYLARGLPKIGPSIDGERFIQQSEYFHHFCSIRVDVRVLTDRPRFTVPLISLTYLCLQEHTLRLGWQSRGLITLRHVRETKKIKKTLIERKTTLIAHHGGAPEIEHALSIIVVGGSVYITS